MSNFIDRILVRLFVDSVWLQSPFADATVEVIGRSLCKGRQFHMRAARCTGLIAQYPGLLLYCCRIVTGFHSNRLCICRSASARRIKSIGRLCALALTGHGS